MFKKSIIMNISDKLAIFSLIIAILSTIITIVTIIQTRIHNRKSLKPIISVITYDYINCLKIELVNEGVGPAIIKKIVVEKNEHEKKDNLYSWMPKLPYGIHYKNYLTRESDLAMLSGKNIEMLFIQLDPEIEIQRNYREKMRGTLRQLTIKIEYTDVYNSDFPTYSKKLDLYARTDND